MRTPFSADFRYFLEPYVTFKDYIVHGVPEIVSHKYYFSVK